MTKMSSSVTRSVTLNASLTEVWGLVGDFHGFANWHPAFEGSTRQSVGDEEFRLLALVGGGEILEHLVGRTTHSYTYSIIRSPLPIAHYEGKMEANTAGASTEVTWSCSYTPLADDTEELIGGVYQAGLDALAEKFGT